MDVYRRQLTTLLQVVAREAGGIAAGLSGTDQGQFQTAVAVRRRALEYQHRLSSELAVEQAQVLALHLEQQAALCSRALAPLRRLLEEAAAVARRLAASSPGPSRTDLVRSILGVQWSIPSRLADPTVRTHT
jgi:hypothetical protein